MEEPLEGEEAGHRDGEDKLAEWVHGHPTPLWEHKERKDEAQKQTKTWGETSGPEYALYTPWTLKSKNLPLTYSFTTTVSVT